MPLTKKQVSSGVCVESVLQPILTMPNTGNHIRHFRQTHRDTSSDCCWLTNFWIDNQPCNVIHTKWFVREIREGHNLLHCSTDRLPVKLVSQLFG